MEYENIKKLLKKEKDKRIIEAMNSYKKGSLTDEQIKKVYKLRTDTKDLKKGIIKYFEKRFKQQLKQLNEISKAKEFKPAYEYEITIKTHKNKKYGYTARAQDNDGRITRIVGGGGYDKKSQALSELLNINKSILKKLCDIKEQDINKDNEFLFGYGISGSIPYFTGGVGVETLVMVLKKIGLKVEYYNLNNQKLITISNKKKAI